MDLRELHKLLNTVQSQLLCKSCCDFNEIQVGLMYGIYKASGGTGKLKGLTNDQKILAHATEFFIKESSKEVEKTDVVKCTKSLTDRFESHANKIGLVIQKRLKDNEKACVINLVIEDNKLPNYLTGKEIDRIYFVEKTISQGSMIDISYMMYIEDLTVAMMSIKGCAFSNTGAIIREIKTLGKRLS